MSSLFKHTNMSSMTLKGFTLNHSMDHVLLHHASSAFRLHQLRGVMRRLADVGLMGKMRDVLCGRLTYADLIEPLNQINDIHGLKIISGKTIRALGAKSDDRKKNAAIHKMMSCLADYEVNEFIQEAIMVRNLVENRDEAQRAMQSLGFDMDDDCNLTKFRDLSVTFAEGHKFSESQPYGDGLIMVNFHGPQQEFNERIQTLILTEPIDALLDHTVPYR